MYRSKFHRYFGEIYEKGFQKSLRVTDLLQVERFSKIDKGISETPEVFCKLGNSHNFIITYLSIYVEIKIQISTKLFRVIDLQQ